MPTEVTFETASFVDAVRRACRVAPTKGHSFDKASGVVIEVNPGEEFPVVIRATNLDVYYMQWVEAESATGDRTVWRFPSTTLDAVAATLPMARGNKVRLATDGGLVKLTQRRIVAKLNVQISDDYPIWQAFDPTGMVEAPNLGAVLARVEWAAADAGEAITGVKLDGKTAVATDRYCVAVEDFPLELDEPYILRARTLTPVLPPGASVMIGAGENFLHVMPDEQTQIKVLAMAGEFPSALDTILAREEPESVEVGKTEMLQLIERALSINGANRNPLLKVYIGRGEVACMLDSSGDTGILGDVIETPGHCDHGRIQFGFSPKSLSTAISNAPGDRVTISYNPGMLNRPIRIKGHGTYQALVAVRGKDA